VAVVALVLTTSVALITRDGAVATRPPTPARLKLIQSLGGPTLSPKSVVASSRGHVIAQNMMYTHGVSVFAADGTAVTRVSDVVPRRMLGLRGKGTAQGSPVEAAFSPDGRYAYVSNYYMTGNGFNKKGFDKCSVSEMYDNSYLYKIDMLTYKVISAVAVGAVPKYVAVTPNNKYALVSNWCSYTISVIDLSTFSEVTQIRVGRYPRGIVSTKDSTRAYFTVMGESKIGYIDLATLTPVFWKSAASTPRHIVLSPDDSILYVTHNLSSVVTSHNAKNGRVIRRVLTGTEPRTMDITPDGSALYVVNYASHTLTVVDTFSMLVTQSIATPPKPIGVAYEPTLKRVWVASYGGQIRVYQVRQPK
jgi:YVTN family beta-propeller protein